FFFQEEDGIRGDLVTGVQTCALPISVPADAWPFHAWSGRPQPRGIMMTSPKALSLPADSVKEMLPLRPVDALEYDPSHCPASARSEERRVGDEWVRVS